MISLKLISRIYVSINYEKSIKTSLLKIINMFLIRYSEQNIGGNSLNSLKIMKNINQYRICLTIYPL